MGLHNSKEKGCELACDSMQLEKGRYYYREIRTIPNMSINFDVLPKTKYVKVRYACIRTRFLQP